MEERKCDLVDLYKESEENCSEKQGAEMLQGLYGPRIDKRHCVGYCKYHRCYMTVKQMKKKECLQKQCNALERILHQFWIQRELKKQKKRKDKLKENLKF